MLSYPPLTISVPPESVNRCNSDMSPAVNSGYSELASGRIMFEYASKKPLSNIPEVNELNDVKMMELADREVCRLATLSASV